MGNTVSTELVHDGARRDRLGRKHVPEGRRLELLAMFRESGLTRYAFARREGIRYTTLCTWVHQDQKSGGHAKAPEAPVRFAQVQVPPSLRLPEAVAETTHLEVRLSDGTSVRGNKVKELAALVRALRG